MMKYVKRIVVCLLILCMFIPVFFASSSNTTLVDLRNKYNSDLARYNSITSKKNALNGKINSAQKELGNINGEIAEAEKEKEEAKAKIEELKKEIENKQLEIDNLVNFKQISSGDNVYLEYIFKAKTFTDFIYRITVVEQLTKYNDGLIDEMESLIEENKKAEKELEKKIEKSEDAYDKLNKTLSGYNVTMDDLDGDHKDAKSELDASKKELQAYEKLYKEYGCKDTDSIVDCVKVPYVDGFIRPITSGSVTSNFGIRYHPTQHVYKMHNGIDLGVSMNTKVYAAAGGIVTKIVEVANPAKGIKAKKSVCGGNKVYVKHRYKNKDYTTSYLHLHQINVKLNEYVTTSTVIGLSGGGESYDPCTTGPHLHFAIQNSNGSFVDPRDYVNFPKKGSRFSGRY